MSSLVDVDDLADWLKKSTADLNVASAELALELASDLVRAELGQIVHYVPGDVVDLVTRGASVLLLPELPVWDVTTVRERAADGTFGDPLTAYTDYTVEHGADHRMGILRRQSLGASWPLNRDVEVTYDHGYGTLYASGSPAGAELPGAIRSTVLRVAARGYSNPRSLRQVTIGRYSETTGGDTPGLALTAADRHDLDAFYPGHRAGAR